MLSTTAASLPTSRAARAAAINATARCQTAFLYTLKTISSCNDAPDQATRPHLPAAVIAAPSRDVQGIPGHHPCYERMNVSVSS